MTQFPDRIPVSIITGFLGAGKSTLLNQILKDPDMRDAALIINEFGEVGIDHLLVEASSDSIVELSDGCLCCTVRGELVDTMAELIDGMQTGRLKRLSRIVIETTGLADPAPVMQSVMGHPAIAQHFDLDGVIAVVDAVNGLSTLDSFQEAVRQVAVADRLVLTKQTLADPETIAALTARLRALNPRAGIENGDVARARPASLLVNGLYDPSTKIADVDRWLKDEIAHDHGGQGHDDHHHHDVNRHNASIRSYSIVHDVPIDPLALEMFVDLLRSTHADKILRMKAIVALTDRPDRPLVLHGVQSIFHPPVRLPAWPGDDRRTRLVLITRDLSESYVRDLFGAFTGKLDIDRPDRAAMLDNPLAVPGLRF